MIDRHLGSVLAFDQSTNFASFVHSDSDRPQTRTDSGTSKGS